MQDRKHVLAMVESEAEEIASKFGSDRRTVMSQDISSSMSVEDIIPINQSLVVYSKKGYIKRIPADIFSVQARGGTGEAISLAVYQNVSKRIRRELQAQEAQ